MPSVQPIPQEPGLRGGGFRLQVDRRRHDVGHTGSRVQRRGRAWQVGQQVRGSPGPHHEPGERPPLPDRAHVRRRGHARDPILTKHGRRSDMVVPGLDQRSGGKRHLPGLVRGVRQGPVHRLRYVRSLRQPQPVELESHLHREVSRWRPDVLSAPAPDRDHPLPDPLPNAPWRSDNNLWVAVDRSTNQIYVNYADYNAGDADVKVIRVHDDGGSFSVQRITRVNNDSTASDQFFPFVTVAPNGRVDVCYQDRSYAPGNALLFTTCGASTDAGVSFTNQQVTTTPFDASNNNFIGDYNWQVATANTVVPIFVGDGVPGGGSLDEEVFIAIVTP